MIQIQKSKNIPNRLLIQGKNERLKNENLYTADPNSYNSGVKKFDFKSDIYGHSTVKKQLKTEQHNKCCFCENKDFDDIANGDVEHFRPKGGYQQKANDRIQRPGYYWLAYEWENLFFSCQICNGRYKKNRFPLVNNSLRALNHTTPQEDVTNVLIVHPSLENPESFIGYREEVPYGKNPKGTKSIQAFGLKRSKLNEKRRKHLKQIKYTKMLLRNQRPLPDLSQTERAELMRYCGANNLSELEDLFQMAKDFVRNAAKDEAQFSGMVRANFLSYPR